MKKFVFLFFTGLLLHSLNSAGQKFKVNTGFLLNRNVGTYNFVEQENSFNTKRLHTNTGLQLGASYYPFKKLRLLFIEAGIRLNTTEAYVSAINDVPGHGNGWYPTLYWGYRWQAVTVPIHLGYTLRPLWFKGGYLDILAGVSYGTIQYSMFESGSMLTKRKNDTDLIGAGMGGAREKNKAFSKRSLATADIGFRLAPLPKRPKWSLGFMLVYNLNNTTGITRDAFIANITQNIVKPYYYNLDMHFVNYLFSLNYSFGKKWKQEMLPSHYSAKSCF